ncbi:MAG: hypothetical protein HC913_01525 [Microscillaceae bacterium]|nr:hypothetical protein [Microscillaceae bacterium]
MRFLALGGLVLALLGPLNAQPQSRPDTLPSIDLPDIVITGTRTVRDRMALPVPVTVVSGQAIQRTGLSRLNEVLQEQTGLLTVPDFGGGKVYNCKAWMRPTP